MLKMLIIADDFTGALDTGIKFVASGASTKVVTNIEASLSAADCDVMVLCAPTRHLPPEEAYQMIRGITERAVRAGVSCIYKKTDSALRGNVGAELSAVLEGSGEMCINFIPALPALNRVTTAGVQYIDGAPVHESVFGRDPFEPVKESFIPALLNSQCDAAVEIISLGHMPEKRPDRKTIRVFDCVTRQDMETLASQLRARGELHLLAGCAGLAETLPPCMGLTGRVHQRKKAENISMLVFCGSMNPISLEQIDYAERRGCRRFHVPASRLLAGSRGDSGEWVALTDELWNAYLHTDCLLVDTVQDGAEPFLAETEQVPKEELRQRISDRLGELLKAMLDRGANSRLVIIGGDTLMAAMKALHCAELHPVEEVTPGVVLVEITYRNKIYELLTKSGGFGEQNLLTLLRAGAQDAAHTGV